MLCYHGSGWDQYANAKYVMCGFCLFVSFKTGYSIQGPNATTLKKLLAAPKTLGAISLDVAWMI